MVCWRKSSPILLNLSVLYYQAIHWAARFGQMILLMMMVTVMMVIRLVLVKLLKLIVDNMT